MPEKPLLKPIQRPILTAPKKVSETKIVCENTINAEQKVPIRKTETGKLNIKATSPTLLEFQHKENVIPEWRLELKNAVRQKLQRDQSSVGDPELFPRRVSSTAPLAQPHSKRNMWRRSKKKMFSTKIRKFKMHFAESNNHVKDFIRLKKLLPK